MGLFGKFKDLVGIEEVDDDDLEDEIKEAESTLAKKQAAPEPQRNSFMAPRPEPAKLTAVPPRANPNTNPYKLVIIEPSGFEECPRLVDNLRAKKPVIINLNKVEADSARKIFDFLSGATYALNGNVQKIENNIFVFAPENFDITASVEHKGIDFSGNPKSPWR